MVDEVLLHDVSQQQVADLTVWNQEKDYWMKDIFDYTYLLWRCQDTGPQWVAMIEDDSLAFKGRCPRAIKALATADDQDVAIDNNDWLYLRLSVEESLGWSMEVWSRYFTGSIVFPGMVAVVGRYISKKRIAFICLVRTPACILYPLAGRLSMQPLTPGVYQMPRLECYA